MQGSTRQRPCIFKTSIHCKTKYYFPNTKAMDKISELEQRREKKILANESERQAAKPELTDRNQIKDIYEHYKIVAKERNLIEGSSDYLQKFLYVILTLYAPAVLLPKEIRDKMPRGLRDNILSSVGLSHHKTVISHNVSVVSIYYNNYKAFRYDVDYIYADILFWLERSKGV